jgi:hypothetical protein
VVAVGALALWVLTLLELLAVLLALAAQVLRQPLQGHL